MWEYTDELKDHFFNPRNVGEVENPDGVGEVGSLACGDALKLTFKLDENGKIKDAQFKTFGCASAIATSSVLTEMIKGKTLEEAEKVTNKDIADYLGGLPEQKMHCSVMGREALEAAIENYRSGGKKKHELEGRVVCNCFGVTENEIERINTIIRQLLEISRPSNTALRAVEVHALIDDIADVLRVQPLMSNIELERRLGAKNDVVLADPNQLRQVFLNLMINAADAISSMDKDVAGQLKITTELEIDTETESQGRRSMLKIILFDNGAGIPENNLGNIFDPFFTTKEPGKGTGLGLSVSFMIVEGLGGKMTVNSEVGQGTTMIIYLPLFKPGQQ